MGSLSNGSNIMKVPLGFGGFTASIGDHIAHFYRGKEQMFSVLGPYIAEGIRRGDRCGFISSPKDADLLCEWLTSRGLDAAGVCDKGQMILHPGEATKEEMRAFADRIEAESLKAGHKFVRWAGDGGWALAGLTPVPEMLRWEALYDDCSVGWEMIALCQFDLTQFGGDVVMDVLRSHPLCIMGHLVVPNPFHIPPRTLLNELLERD